jgi:hypothetical protein
MFPDGVVARSGYRMRSAERDGAMTETHRPIWTIRHHLARWLIHTGLRVMPAGRFRSEVSAALWGVNFQVMAHNAALQAAVNGVTDV